MAVVASFHLTRYPTRHALAAMARRRPPTKVPGLRFARPLGTGRGEAMGLGADLRRWALFATWDDDEAVDAFLTTSPEARRWKERGVESWSVRLAPLGHHGTWRGRDPLAGADPETEEHREGSVAVLTRATITPRHWRSFYRAIPPVERSLAEEPGLLAALGVGELPIGRLATFSLWRSANDLEAFAYRGSPHHEVVRRTRSEGWFTEELFARFRPYGSTGTWDGKDPLALAGGNGSKAAAAARRRSSAGTRGRSMP